MSRWTVEKARDWYERLPWMVGCNFLPSSAVNQLEMWQADTYDRDTIEKEISWAEALGFNTLRVYLHDLLWTSDRAGLISRIGDFLAIAGRHRMKVILVLFDDCHRPDPESGRQPLPVRGIHNSGWKQSPGRKRVLEFSEGTVSETEQQRLQDYVQGVLTRFSGDDRILMWDIYNEPGQNGYGDMSFNLLQQTWKWARDARPSQPLTSCQEGAMGERNLELNRQNADILTFHCYDSSKLEPLLKHYTDQHDHRPAICTEYMARELGTTFEFSLPLFVQYRVGCLNWGLVAGKSQTHFNWASVAQMEALKKNGHFIHPHHPIPEPTLWFHDIFRRDGTAFDPAEIAFIQRMINAQGWRHPAAT